MDDTTRRRLIDLGAAVLVTAALWLRVAGPFESTASPPDWRAYTLMALIGATMLVRRRFPLGILAFSFVVLLAYYMMGFGAVGSIWPLSPALFNVALLGRWRTAAVTGALVLGGSLAYRLLLEPEPATLQTLSDTLTEVFLGVAVVLAGAMVRNHHHLVTASRAREAAVVAEREAETRRRLTEQRLDIARDVHDIVAHSLAGIGVQARLAEELVGPDAEAHASIRAIIDTTSDAMRQLRQTVGDLRGAPGQPATLVDLVAGVTGPTVRLERSRPARPPDDPTEMTIIAIVREALTNAVRHSGATTVTVTVDDRPDRVVVEVTDDGRGGPAVEGNGIRGMRERAASMGGTLRAGPVEGGGFSVRAELPT